MDRWQISRGGQVFGPYPWQQLVEMARTGLLIGADLLWQEGTVEWRPAQSFADRLPLAAPPAQPPPPMAPPVTIGAAGAAPLSPAVDARAWARQLGFHVKRALEWNLRATPVTADETRELISLGVDDEESRKYHAWRRSVLTVILLFGGVTVLLDTISAAAADHSNLSGFGGFLEVLQIASLLVMPVMALRALRVWSRHKRSRRIAAIGWIVSFGAPLLFALIPVTARYDVDGGIRDQVRLVGAMAYYITLMPTVLALIPGIMRACLRIKVLLPQSILPGWFLVGAAPIWMFLFMVIFVTVNQLAGDFLLIVGVLAITGAPLLYLLHVALITRPLSSDDDQKRLLQIQRQVRLILTVGIGFLLLWLFTASMFGKDLIGIDADKSMIRPWSIDLIRLPVEFVSHSMFTMCLAADLFMVMNLSVWKHTKEFVGSAAAGDYDRRMNEIEEAGDRD